MLNPLDMDDLQASHLPGVRFCRLVGGKKWNDVDSCRFRLLLNLDVLDLHRLHSYDIAWCNADCGSWSSVSSGVCPNDLDLKQDLIDVIADQQRLIGKPYVVVVFLDPHHSRAYESWFDEFTTWGFVVAREVFHIS